MLNGFASPMKLLRPLAARSVARKVIMPISWQRKMKSKTTLTSDVKYTDLQRAFHDAGIAGDTASRPDNIPYSIIRQLSVVAMATLVPVSYTHLDVYKRQRQ